MNKDVTVAYSINIWTFVSVLLVTLMNINETHLKKWSAEECWGVVTEMLEARLLYMVSEEEEEQQSTLWVVLRWLHNDDEMMEWCDNDDDQLVAIA